MPLPIWPGALTVALSVRAGEKDGKPGAVRMRLLSNRDEDERWPQQLLRRRLLATAVLILLFGLGLLAWARLYPAPAALLEGEWRLRAGDIRGADSAFQRFLLLNQESADSFVIVASRYIAAERWDAAARSLERAVQTDPSHRARVDLGIVYEHLGRDDEAEAAYREAIRHRPDDAYALNALGYFYAQRAMHLDEALALLHRALELLPNDGSIMDSLGWALYQRGDVVAALRQLAASVERVPSFGEVRLHLGVALARRGARDQALVELGKAVMLDPELPGAREALETVRRGGLPPLPFPYEPPARRR